MASIEDFKPYSEFFRSQRQQRSSRCFDFINVPSSPTGKSFLRNFKSHLSSDETPVFGVIAYGWSYRIHDQIGYEISFNDDDTKPYYTLLTTSGIHHLDYYGIYSFSNWGERDAKFWLDKHDIQLLVGNANNTNAKKWKALFRDINASKNCGENESFKSEAIGNNITSLTDNAMRNQSFRLTIDGVFHIEGRGVVATGTVESGEVHVGDELYISGNGKSLYATVTGIEMFRKLLDQAEEGDNCGVLLRGVTEDEVEEGMVMSSTPVSSSTGYSSSSKGKSSSSTTTSSSSKTTNQTTQYHSKSKVSMDQKKIEYVIGIDLGHGETSAAICPMQWDKLDTQLDPAKDLEMEPNRKVIPSAITITEDGTAKIGTAAFDPNILKKAKVNVCFKKKPTDINGEAEQLMIRFMQEVYRKIRENNSGMLSDGNHVVYIATPSGWDKTAQNLYLDMARKAGIPMGGITKESRAAFVRAQHDPTANLGRNIEKGAIVFDMGSSTLDFTYHNSQLSNMIDNGYDCGASFVEKSMFGELEKNNDAIQEFRSKYPDLIDFLLFETRRAKEELYFDTNRKYKKTINFEDFIDDEDLEDERFRLKYEPGELNQFLTENGYIDSIRNAMRDYISNHISGKNIYGVFMTGGASRMDFLKPLITQCWNVPEDKIFRDQDPSLTISEGVAEVARIDMRTSDLDKGLESLFQQVSGNGVYNKFVDLFGNYLYNNVAEKVQEVIIDWRDSQQKLSLNYLNSRIKNGVKSTVDECSQNVTEGIQISIEEETKELREKVDAIVAAYTAQGTNVNLPSLSDLEVMNGGVGVDMSGVLHELASSIETESSNWGGLIAGAGIGAAVAMILGGPLAWIIGGGALLGKWLFGEEESEEQKRQKAMSKELSSEERAAVCNTLGEKWDDIMGSINNSVFKSLQNNNRARRDVASAVDRLMSAYKDALKKSRIMVD